MTTSLSNDQIEDKYFLLGKMEILNISMISLTAVNLSLYILMAATTLS